ncbi:MAG: hypothetical protein ACXVFI_18290 [Solirubrobacteraceae bacterium]
MRDLEDYFTQLRNYYDIPEDQPVFPERNRKSLSNEVRDVCDIPNPRRRRATGRNRDDHPWRNTL